MEGVCVSSQVTLEVALADELVVNSPTFGLFEARLVAEGLE